MKSRRESNIRMLQTLRANMRQYSLKVCLMLYRNEDKGKMDRRVLFSL